jgi:hypothetical protein
MWDRLSSRSIAGHHRVPTGWKAGPTHTLLGPLRQRGFDLGDVAQIHVEVAVGITGQAAVAGGIAGARSGQARDQTGPIAKIHVPVTVEVPGHLRSAERRVDANHVARAHHHVADLAAAQPGLIKRQRVGSGIDKQQ